MQQALLGGVSSLSGVSVLWQQMSVQVIDAAGGVATMGTGQPVQLAVDFPDVAIEGGRGAALLPTHRAAIKLQTEMATSHQRLQNIALTKSTINWWTFKSKAAVAITGSFQNRIVFPICTEKPDINSLAQYSDNSTASTVSYRFLDKGFSVSTCPLAVNVMTCWYVLSLTNLICVDAIALVDKEISVDMSSIAQVMIFRHVVDKSTTNFPIKSTNMFFIFAKRSDQLFSLNEINHRFPQFLPAE